MKFLVLKSRKEIKKVWSKKKSSKHSVKHKVQKIRVIIVGNQNNKEIDSYDTKYHLKIGIIFIFF